MCSRPLKQRGASCAALQPHVQLPSRAALSSRREGRGRPRGDAWLDAWHMSDPEAVCPGGGSGRATWRRSGYMLSGRAKGRARDARDARGIRP